MMTGNVAKAVTVALILFVLESNEVTARLFSSQKPTDNNIDKESEHAVPKQKTRHLANAGLSNKLQWTECRKNKLSAEDCKDLIEAEVKAHIIPDIDVEIRYPVTHHPRSYWKVGIPTNYAGVVTGNTIDGQIHWKRFAWEGDLGYRKLGPWDCGGLDAIQCCNNVLSDVPDKDKRGKYMVCYVRQDHPSTYVKRDGSIGYCSWEWDDTAQVYEPIDVKVSVLEAADTKAKQLLEEDLVDIEKFLTNRKGSYEEMKTVNNSCHLNGRDFARLQTACNNMDAIFHPPNKPGGTIHVSTYLDSVLRDIQRLIEMYIKEPFDLEHIVTVHSSDAKGTSVTSHPVVGGMATGPPCIPK